MFNKETDWKQIVMDLWEKVECENDDPYCGTTFCIEDEDFYDLTNLLKYLIEKYTKEN